MKKADDDGVGLVEIIVAMFVLTILTLSLAPILVLGLKTSAQNATLAAGIQLVNDRIHLAEANAPSCDNIRTALGPATLPTANTTATTGTYTTTDARGVTLLATTTIGGCPSSGTGTVSVSTVVTRTDTGAALASAATLILVTP